MASPAAVWRPVVTEILRERLDAGESVWLPVRGRSMRPLLGSGSRIFVTPPAQVRFGDLLAYEWGGALVCHRMIGRRGPALLARADHQGAGPEVVAASQVVGVVTAFERDGVTVDLLTLRQRALATFAAARSFAAAACVAARRRAWPVT
jgi:Peptidase S24-like